MTQSQLIEELLLEASGLGIRQEVLNVSEKYLDQGMDQLEALEAAFNELTDDDYVNTFNDDDYTDFDNLPDFPDFGEEDDDWYPDTDI
jgi:hypothetical protein